MRGIIWISAAILAIGFGGVDSQSVPNSTAIDGLKQFPSKSYVLNFYEALKSLYLSGGFSKGNQFNSNVLGQKNISAVLWNQMSDIVKRTQREVKNGDFSMKRMDAQLKLYSILTKSGIRNDGSSLASGIATGSGYPKNLAFAVRDLVAYVAENPEMLEWNAEQNVKNWLDAQNLSFNADFPSILAIVLSNESKEDKLNITDILEALPYQVRGIYPADSEAINDFAQNVQKLVLQQAQGKTMMNSFRAAFRNLTNATDAADTIDNFLYQLASADVTLNTTVVDLEAQGMSLSNRRMGVRKENNRLIRSSNRLVEVLREKNGYPEFKNFSLKSKKALDSGIESLENVRIAMIAGARLIRNLGSIEQAITAAELVPIAAKSDRDISWRHRVGGALQVFKYLPKATTDNRIGGQMLLKSVLQEPKLYDKMVFLKTKTSNKTLMLAMFEKMKGVGQQTIGNVARTIRTWTLDTLSDRLKDISARNRLSVIQNVFGAVDVKTADDALNGEYFLNSLYDATVTTDNLTSICADLITISTDVTDYAGFVQGLVDAVQLSRDGDWQDVWNALSTTSRTLFSTSPNYPNVLDPISYVVNLEGQQMTLINLREAFLALQQLSRGTAEVVEAKVKFIKDFYGGLKPDDVAEILKAFDVDAEQIGARVTATMYVDDFLDVLDTSGSLVDLNKLLGFHRNFTTDAANPDESLKKIIGMITYLQTELAKSAKVKARSIDQNTRFNKFQFKNRKN